MGITITKKPKGLVYGQIGKKRDRCTQEEREKRLYKKYLQKLKATGWQARKIEEIIQSIDDKFYGRIGGKNAKTL